MQDKTNESYYTCQTVHSNKKAIKQMINNKQNNNNKKNQRIYHTYIVQINCITLLNLL